jgi:two-component system clock-associated histidine kinase SasA
MRPSPEQPSKKSTKSEALLQLLLFIDERSTATEQIRQIRTYLQTLRSDYAFDLQVIDVGKQPYLAEHFKLVATPALIKINPEPRHILAGTSLVAQLESCWPRWQKSLEAYVTAVESQTNFSVNRDLAHSGELMQLADEIFRLNQENEALQDQLRFKDRVIAMLAHELRNPLTAVSIALETLEGYWNLQNSNLSRLPPEMLTRLMQHARSQTQVIDRMITNLLQTSRAKNSELDIHPRKLDLKTLCQGVLDDLKSNFQAKSQQIKADIPHDLPYVHADGDRVRQVIINLLENASKYTPIRGTIQVSVLHRTTQKVQVSICDNGLGVPLENQERIFENQFRLQRDEHQEGYGIGLALCRQIIRAHYGQIWVDSTSDQGSCFHFTLPVYRT